MPAPTVIDARSFLTGRTALADAPFTTTVQTHIYVMDMYGNLFFQKATVVGRQVDQEASQFNHSSLNAGNSVICAGVLEATAGKLTKISSESGHYAPSHLNLAECLKYLDAEGLDLTDTVVYILTASPESPFGPWGAAMFRADPDSCLHNIRARAVAAPGGPSRPLGLPGPVA